jgi:flagellar basal-body rod protein FlgF
MMQAGLYVSLSGQMALDRRMATLANNIANVGTVGFRAEEMKFDTVLSTVSRAPTAFATAGESFISDRSGGFSKTGNPLDVAIQGKGWLAVQTPQGVAYTRDGRLQISDTGELQTLTGYQVLDSGLAPLQLDPALGEPRIARDGTISQKGATAGTLGLFTIDPAQGYRRGEGATVVPATAAQPVTSFVADGFAQGFVEASNVNGVAEMTNLIRITRSFDSLQSALDAGDAAFRKAIQTLAG